MLVGLAEAVPNARRRASFFLLSSLPARIANLAATDFPRPASPTLPFDHPLAAGCGPDWASAWGEDRQFGPFAIVELPPQGKGKPVRQRFHYVPPGSFQMGSPPDELGRWHDEGPQHWVTLSRGFWMGETTCTQSFWSALMGENPSRFKSAECPVERVSWDDVQSFLSRLNSHVGGSGVFSLPTEAQWEYACRAGSPTALYRVPGGTGAIEILGDRNAPALDDLAWYGGNSGVGFDLDEGWDSSDWQEKQYAHERAGTRAVCGKTPNMWGLYDMLGNVWEWCADGKRAYSNSAELDPFGPLEGVESRVVRGGSWSGHARYVRCAYRGEDLVVYLIALLGFRLVRVQ